MRALPSLVVSAFLVTACGVSSSDDGAPEPAKPGFDIEPNADGYMMRLSREALSRPFLLAPALASGPPLALSTAYPPRIVRFEEKNSRLYLFEDTSKGVLGTSSLAAHHLLAEFALVDERAGTEGGTSADVAASGDAATLVFDFNAGITSYLMAMINEFGDLGGGGPVPEGVLTSLVDKVYVKGSTLFVDQFVEMAQGAGGTPFVAQVKYTLAPYVESTTFPKRTGSEAFARVGFFENWLPERDVQGYGRFWINRWDSSKPIVFHVPTTIPEDFKPAVRDGILYWNRAFGREVLQVMDLPAGISPHEPGYNVVQWLDNETMSFAYADWVSDPRTGETLQAQIFMPATFVVDARAAAAEFIAAPRAFSELGLPARDLRTRRTLFARDSEVSVNRSQGGRHAAGRRPKACFQDRRGDFATSLGTVLALDAATDEAVKRFSQDVVRAIVAHEIGHTLGLRHNFHAKNGATVPPTELAFALGNYVKTGNPPLDQSITNSVMDYLGFEYTALAGAQIRLGLGAFKYDNAAIGWGYAGTAMDHRAVDFGGFCSDELESSAPDCLVFTTPGPPIEATFATHAMLESGAVAALAASFVAAKVPIDAGAPMPVQEVPLDPSSSAFKLTDPFFYLNAMLKDFEASGASFLSISDTFKYNTSLNRKEEDAAILAYQTAAVASFGGIAGLFTPLTPVEQPDGNFMPPLVVSAAQRFKDLVASPTFAGGLGPRGNAYAFSPEELAYMSGAADEYFRKFGERLVIEAVTIITGADAGKFADFDHAGLGAALKGLASAILLAEGPERVSGDVGGVVVEAKKPYYQREFRLAATALLGSDAFDAFPETFNEGASVELAATLASKITALTRDGAVSVQELPVELKKLAVELQEVIDSLPNKVPPL